MQKVLFIDSVHPLIAERLTERGLRCEMFTGSSRKELMEQTGDCYGIIIRSKFTIDREVLDHAPVLRFIGRVGAGMENIDVPYAESKGIACLNSPEGNRDAVGEHALGMLLALVNNILKADREVRSGTWEREGNRGIELKGRTIGIIGYGNMGSAFAQRLKGFESEVISYDKYKTGYSDGNTRETTLDELFLKADIVSLHVPLTEETHYMADDSFLGRFSKNIWLINTSRGPVVKTSDLVKNLRSGKVLGAALDVLEYEDSSFERLGAELPNDLRYLISAGNVILTPHIAGWTRESNVKLASVLVDKILSVL
jgi:D-3-phosphoglycerate dehydrogenase / 2-oxoglutarate reductase